MPRTCVPRWTCRQGHGVLQTLVADRRAVGGRGCGRTPSFGRLSPGRPVMRALLGVPLMVRGTVYGDLYLADKTDGTPFDDDQNLPTALASAASISIE
ncbi:GAF domain-containing protein [Streptomyces sp. NPDC054783]